MADQHTSQRRDSGIVTFKPTEDQVVVPNGRRQFGRWALASAGLLALAACGGGSSGSDSGSGSGRVDLYWAFDQLRDGMTPEDVERIVGAPANAERRTGFHVWIYGSQRLNVSYALPSGTKIVNSRIMSIDGSRPSLERVFNI